jgi:hypothetical protein
MFSRHAPSAARPPLQAKAILPYIKTAQEKLSADLTDCADFIF